MKAKDRKFITVSTRLTKKQADEFKECARKRHMTTAQFLRMLAEQRLNELRTTVSQMTYQYIRPEDQKDQTNEATVDETMRPNAVDEPLSLDE